MFQTRCNFSNIEIAPTENSHPHKMKSLIDIYNTCNFVLNVSDPVKYKDVIKHMIWQEVMDEEFLHI